MCREMLLMSNAFYKDLEIADSVSDVWGIANG